MFKKIITGFILVATTFAISGTASAAISGDYQYFSLYDGEVSLYKYLGTEKDVVIPDRIDGKLVTDIGSSAFGNLGLTSVTIPNSIKTIGTGAFGNNNLTSVVIPAGVTKIGNTAFRNNPITSLTLSEGITEIGSNTFQNNQLTSLNLPNGLTKVGSYAFFRNQLESVSLPSSLKEIGNMAFGENQLTQIAFPTGLEKIGERAFVDNLLTSVKLEHPLVSVDSLAFSSNKISQVEIPLTSSMVSDTAFNDNFVDLFGYKNQYTYSVPTETIKVDINSTTTLSFPWSYNGVDMESVFDIANPADTAGQKVSDSNGNTFGPIEWNKKTGENTVDFTATKAGLTQVSVQLTEGYIKTFNIEVIAPTPVYGICEAPIDLVLVMDASWSFNERIGTVKNTVNTIIDTLKPTDRAMVVSFQGRNGNRDSTGTIPGNISTSEGMEIKVQAPLTSDKTALKQGINNIVVKGSTPTASGLEKAFSEYERTKGTEQGRTTIFLLITDGIANVRTDGWLYANYPQHTIDRPVFGDNFERLQDYKTAIDQTAAVADAIKGEGYNLITSFLEDKKYLSSSTEYPDNYGIVGPYSSDALRSMASSPELFVADSLNEYLFSEKLLETFSTNTCIVPEDANVQISAQDRTIYVGDSFNPMEGVTATENNETNITPSVQVVYNDVDNTTPGVYSVSYMAINSSDVKAYATARVDVLERPVVPAPPVEVPVVPETPPVVVPEVPETPIEEVPETPEVPVVEEPIIEEPVNEIPVIEEPVAEEEEIINDAPPVLTAEDQRIKKGTLFNALAWASAHDSIDGEVEDIVVLSNTVDITVPGVYSIEYRAVNSRGLSSDKTIEVEVYEEAVVPVITPETPAPESIIGKMTPTSAGSEWVNGNGSNAYIIFGMFAFLFVLMLFTGAWVYRDRKELF